MCSIIRQYRVKPDLCTRIIIILESAATAAVARIYSSSLCVNCREVRSPPPPNRFTKLYVYTIARIEPTKYIAIGARPIDRQFTRVFYTFCIILYILVEPIGFRII